MNIKTLLLSPDLAEGVIGSVVQLTHTPPPAASTVLNSDAKESDAQELVKLKRELDDERSGRKKDQIRLSELEDENHRLKTVTPKPAPVEKKGWLSGATFFNQS